MKHKILRLVRWIALRKWWFIGIGIVLFVLLVGPTAYAGLTTRHDRFVAATVPVSKIAIVFGAGVEPDGQPTPYLARRIDTAVRLYHADKVQVILMTGDNSTSHHNEPVAMKRYAERRGVPAGDITLDYAGFNTYDSCYRARAIFGVREATLVTHGYHLPRAIMTCESLGVRSRGVAAENAGTAGRDFSLNYLARELVSTDKAFWQIVFKPQPTALGDYEPIP